MNPTEICVIPPELRKQKKLSILMPFLNEEGVIVQNVRQTIEIMDRLDYNYEIVLIDDGSGDNSFELLKSAFSGKENIKIIRNYQNFGKGWALKTGYEYSTGDFILFLDSDLELSPMHICNFFRLLIENEADAVIGSKLHPDSIVNYPLSRRIISKTYYLLIKIIFGLPVMDTQTGIKLFRREALELSLPKVLVKKFAFDIELLIILYKHHKNIISAPVDLKYTRKSFGNMKIKTFVSTFLDTMAVFYRDKILRFYDRPMGNNTKYFYTIAVFPVRGDDFEKEALLRFMNINYSPYEIIIVGETDFGLKDTSVKFIKTDSSSNIKKIKILIESAMIKGDYVLFSNLDSYPDERFLFTSGRVLSLPDVGAAGGYLVERKERGAFEDISFKVIKSIYLNLNLAYRYRPMNFKNVRELQFEGLFIKTSVLTAIDLKSAGRLLPGYALSKAVIKSGLHLIYTPDLMLYRRFPDSPKGLFSNIRNDAYSRAYQFRSKLYKNRKIIDDSKFLLPMLLLIIIPLSIALSVLSKNALPVLPVLLYYILLLATSVIFYGLLNGWEVFKYTAVLQLYYGLVFISGIIGKKKPG